MNAIDSRGLHSELDEERFTVYLRFPFPRNGFEDPISCEWNEDKELQLRDYISSRTLQRDDIDWVSLAQRFDVTVPFILQQAVWLYEKELDHVRDQMLRLNRNSHSIKQPDIARIAAQEKIRVSGQSRSSRSRASSSFSPRRRRKSSNATEDGRYQSPGKYSTPRNYEAMASSNQSVSCEDPEGEADVSRRLLSQSRMLRFQNKGSSEDETDQTEDDELENELYEAFLPMNVSSKGKSNDGDSTSFSDLSDLSVSKSALEEALLSGYGGSIS